MKRKNHPEIQEGEIFLSNKFPVLDPLYSSGPDPKIVSEFDAINWSTKRAGIIAYDTNGNVIEGAFPVFVQEQELLDAGLTIA